jgi:O-acetylhomoserine (thiol)-lyase
LTTAYDLQSTERASRLFALQEAGNIYTRIGNPTSNIVEKRIADLEGGIAALEVSSGHAAQATAIFAICEAGDHIVSSSKLYGGTVSQFKYTFPRLGIDVTLVDPSDPENFRKAIKPNTKLIFGETVSNQFSNIFPIEEVAKIAEEYGLPLVIDNTAASPYLCRPFEWGAHIVTHSTSKYIGGHGTTIGGVIVDSGKFKWSGSERHKNFNMPDPSYHDVVYADDFGPLAFISKARAGILRDIGTCQSPFNSWIFIQGLETLSLRMDRHVKNAQAVAEFLSDHPKANWVTYAGLSNHPALKNIYQKVPVLLLVSESKADAKQVQNLLITSNSSHMLLTLVMPSRLQFIQPAQHIHNFRMKNKKPQALALILFASQLVSKISKIFFGILIKHLHKNFM